MPKDLDAAGKHMSRMALAVMLTVVLLSLDAAAALATTPHTCYRGEPPAVESVTFARVAGSEQDGLVLVTASESDGTCRVKNISYSLDEEPAKPLEARPIVYPLPATTSWPNTWTDTTRVLAMFDLDNFVVESKTMRCRRGRNGNRCRRRLIRRGCQRLKRTRRHVKFTCPAEHPVPSRQLKVHVEDDAGKTADRELWLQPLPWPRASSRSGLEIDDVKLTRDWVPVPPPPNPCFIGSTDGSMPPCFPPGTGFGELRIAGRLESGDRMMTLLMSIENEGWVGIDPRHPNSGSEGVGPIKFGDGGRWDVAFPHDSNPGSVRLLALSSENQPPEVVTGTFPVTR